MKKSSLLSANGLFLTCLTFNINATTWSDTGSETINGCTITYQTCERKFLSTDGCNVGDQRAVFDDTTECFALVQNAKLR